MTCELARPLLPLIPVGSVQITLSTRIERSTELTTWMRRPSKSQQAADLARWFLLSPYFKFGFQLMVGIWPISLIIFIRAINWPRVCLAATLYVVNMLMISQDATRGGRLVGAVVLLGPAWVAIIFAGLLVRCISTRSHRITEFVRTTPEMEPTDSSTLPVSSCSPGDIV